jgi:hypothetical protein
MKSYVDDENISDIIMFTFIILCVIIILKF